MKKGFRYGWIGLVLLFMYAPILILAVYSFTDAANIGPFRSFSVHNYVTLFTTPELLNMILGSVILAVGSGLIATILGTSGAIGAFYSKKRVKTAMSAPEQLFLLPHSFCPQSLPETQWHFCHFFLTNAVRFLCVSRSRNICVSVP